MGDLRKDLGEGVNQATFAGRRTAVTRHGKIVAAIIPVEELELLDELERRADLEVLRQSRLEGDGTRIRLDDWVADKKYVVLRPLTGIRDCLSTPEHVQLMS